MTRGPVGEQAEAVDAHAPARGADPALRVQLRKGRVSWPATTLPPGVRVPLEGVSGGALDLEVVLERGTALISGVMIETWASNQGSAAILYDWESSQLEVRSCKHRTHRMHAHPRPLLQRDLAASPIRVRCSQRSSAAVARWCVREAQPPRKEATRDRGVLTRVGRAKVAAVGVQVVFEGLDPVTKEFSLTAPTARRVGGRLEPRGIETLALRCMLDHSLLEVFCGTGQVITTRVYRGAPPKPGDVGIDFLSLGGATEVQQMKAWEVGCIWDSPQVCLSSRLRRRAGMGCSASERTVGADAAPAMPQLPIHPARAGLVAGTMRGVPCGRRPWGVHSGCMGRSAARGRPSYVPG